VDSKIDSAFTSVPPQKRAAIFRTCSTKFPLFLRSLLYFYQLLDLVHTVVIIVDSIDIADVVVVVVHACWIFCSEGRRCCYYCSTAVVDLLLLRILYCCILLYPTLLVPCLSMVLFPYIGFDGNDAPNIK